LLGDIERIPRDGAIVGRPEIGVEREQRSAGRVDASDHELSILEPADAAREHEIGCRPRFAGAAGNQLPGTAATR
jgi:hypothetical protein